MKTNGIVFKAAQIGILESVLIVVFAIIPLFFNFPYRINIYLSWEGAYRLYLGEIPYRDFGLPMGFTYWIIPALFFRIFGPFMLSLVKAQAFINIISAFAFRSILKSLRLDPAVRLLSVLVFLISFSFVNFWPWYNHSVIVFELVSLAFLLRYILGEQLGRPIIWLFLGSFFLFVTFFTKQDAGGLSFLIAFSLIGCHCIYERKVSALFLFIGFYLLSALCLIVPFLPFHFSYWFNYGQPPHNSRISLYDLSDIFFGQSEWIKFYLLVIVLIWMVKFTHSGKSVLQDKRWVIFSLLTAGILAEAAIFQVTSYIPEYNNIFFHSFAFAFIFSSSGLAAKVNFRRLPLLALTMVLIMLWWSARYWMYMNRIIARAVPEWGSVDSTGVSIRTFMRDAGAEKEDSPDVSSWTLSDLASFKGIYMPQGTVDGMHRLLNMPLIKEGNGKNLKVLNMTELTPLAYEIGYKPETGRNIPLWYHKNVGMFQRQIDEYNEKIRKSYYDVALFEYIPNLNNFYPFEVRDSLKKYYRQVDSFPGPRRAANSLIEVYVKK